MSANNPKNTLAEHQQLFNNKYCSTRRESIVQDIIAGQYEVAQRRLQREYQRCFGIELADWNFLEALARVRNAMTRQTVLPHPDKDPQITDIWKGHAPIRDFYGADIDALLTAGLIRRPRVMGEERKRIIHKPYYVLTAEATDCIDAGVVGPGVGDLGESITHAVGARLYGAFMRKKLKDDCGVRVEYYDDSLLDDHEIDVVVYLRLDDADGWRLFSIGEVKTVLSSEQEALNSLFKLGSIQAPCKHWIAPRRELINEIISIAAVRGWFSIGSIPETLALETSRTSNLRSTNQRLEEGEYRGQDNGGPIYVPITKGFSYEMLYRKLKSREPSLFDATPNLDEGV